MDHQYKEHPELTAWLVEGRLEPLPAAEQANATVWFALPSGPGQPQAWEGLRAAHREGDDRVEVRAVPLFAYDVNFGDEVSVVTSAEGPLVATGVLSDAGHYTFRLWLEDGDPAALRQVVMEFGELGCYLEAHSERLLGLSCGQETAQAVADALLAGEERGRFVYETGRQQTH